MDSKRTAASVPRVLLGVYEEIYARAFGNGQSPRLLISSALSRVNEMPEEASEVRTGRVPEGVPDLLGLRIRNAEFHSIAQPRAEEFRLSVTKGPGRKCMES